MSLFVKIDGTRFIFLSVMTSLPPSRRSLREAMCLFSPTESIKQYSWLIFGSFGISRDHVAGKSHLVAAVDILFASIKNCSSIYITFVVVFLLKQCSSNSAELSVNLFRNSRCVSSR